MPTSLVSALLLHRATATGGKWDSPVARSELVERLAALRGDVARCKRDVGFSGEDADAVDLAVSEISQLHYALKIKWCVRLREHSVHSHNLCYFFSAHLGYWLHHI